MFLVDQGGIKTAIIVTGRKPETTRIEIKNYWCDFQYRTVLKCLDSISGSDMATFYIEVLLYMEEFIRTDNNISIKELFVVHFKQHFRTS